MGPAAPCPRLNITAMRKIPSVEARRAKPAAGRRCVRGTRLGELPFPYSILNSECGRRTRVRAGTDPHPIRTCRL